MKLNCFVIDDEILARKGLIEYIQDTDFLNFSGEANNPVDGAKQLIDTDIDILFLDIEMPQMSGLDYLKNFNPQCSVILTTAFPDFALKGFELAVTDYLLKPIPYERFLKSVLRVYNQKKKNTQRVTNIFVKSEGRVLKVAIDDILYLEAMQNYVILHTTTEKHMVHTTMKSFYSTLPQAHFLKVQKSFVANLNKVDAMEGNVLMIKGKKVPISRDLKKIVRDTLVGNRLIGK